MLANLYFRRFILAWKKFGHEQKLQARIVNYADDLVICCRPGCAAAAAQAMRELMTRLGLTVNERKTRVAKLPEDRFDFLGYTIGRFHGRDGVPYIGTQPSKKAVRSLLARVHDETSSRWNWQQPPMRIEALNPILRGCIPPGPALHRTASAPMADAKTAEGRHGLPTVPGPSPV
jgi:hypothetical protein